MATLLIKLLAVLLYGQSACQDVTKNRKPHQWLRP